jgi:hypothetical protein
MEAIESGHGVKALVNFLAILMGANGGAISYVV